MKKNNIRKLNKVINVMKICKNHNKWNNSFDYMIKAAKVVNKIQCINSLN